MEKWLLELFETHPGGYPASYVERLVTGCRPERQLRVDVVHPSPDFQDF